MSMLFGEDHSIESFEQLFDQIRQYLKLHKDLALVNLTGKLSVLLSTLLLLVVLLILGAVALFYLFMALAYAIDSVIGSMAWSFAIIGGLALLLLVVIAAFRHRLIIVPTVNFLSHLFLEGEENKEEEEYE